jgi:hypothetical protein
LAFYVTALLPGTAHAHDLILRYDLPIPFDLYVYGAAAAVVATFVLFAWFMRAPAASRADAARSPDRVIQLPQGLVTAMRALAIAALLLAVLAGLFGTHDPDRNISGTLFREFFMLGLTYATLVIGNVYSFANPWRALLGGVMGRTKPLLEYPAWLGYWPAFAFYVALIWLELFVPPLPRVVGTALAVYSLCVAAGALAFGQAWFRHGEVFSVFLRVVGTLAPVAYETSADGRTVTARFRPLFVGTLEAPVEQMTLVLFVLFMLASTTYDGMHQTIFWMGLFYNHLLSLLQPLWGTDLLGKQATLEKWYEVYQRAGLVAFPFIYLGIYLATMRAVQLVTRASTAVHTLALQFALSVVPIAFVYNLAHYFTLILLSLNQLHYLIVDPFGLGWNPFGLGYAQTDPPVLDMAIVWHVEVALIVIGHLVSVYLAHRVALRLFPSRRDAMLSQLPMLALMVLYTVVGLWVISLPFALT